MTYENLRQMIPIDDDSGIRITPRVAGETEVLRSIAESMVLVGQQITEVKRVLAPIASKMETNGVIMERMCAAIENIPARSRGYGGDVSKEHRRVGVFGSLARMNICGCCFGIFTVGLIAVLAWLTFIFVAALRLDG